MPLYKMDGPTKENPEGSVQYRFHSSRAKVQVFGGGFGNGKTAAACVKALGLAQDYPGSNGLIARESYPKLNDSIRKEFMKWCPSDWVRRYPTKDDNTLYLHNGTTINFRYVQQRGKTTTDGSTTSNLLSSTYDWIVVDQVEDPGITEKDFDDFIGRLRGTTPYQGHDETMPSSGPRWLVLTCNPTANWFWRRIVKPIRLYQQRGIITDELMLDRSGKPMIELYEGSTYTNRKNLTEDFLELIESKYQGQMRDRYLMGEWAAYEGLVYPNFNEDIHMVPEEELMDYLAWLRRKHINVEAIEGYDYGMSSPSCYSFGFKDHWGRVFELDGFYQREYSIPDQAAHIKDIRRKYHHYVVANDRICADPDLYRRKPAPGYKITGITIAGIFESDFGIRMRPSDNTIMTGIAKVHAYLNQYNHPPQFNGQKSALVYFNDKMSYIRDEFTDYYWKRNPQGEQVEEPIDRNDHYLDGLRYKLSFLPDPSELKIPVSEKIPPWMFWSEEEAA